MVVDWVAFIPCWVVPLLLVAVLVVAWIVGVLRWMLEDRPGRFAAFVLSVAQVVSVLGCLAAIVYPFVRIAFWAGSPLWPFLFLLDAFLGVLGFCYNAAMFTVFSWVKQSIRNKRQGVHPEYPAE
jgi:hypothetical protein